MPLSLVNLFLQSTKENAHTKTTYLILFLINQCFVGRGDGKMGKNTLSFQGEDHSAPWKEEQEIRRDSSFAGC